MNGQNDLYAHCFTMYSFATARGNCLQLSQYSMHVKNWIRKNLIEFHNLQIRPFAKSWCQKNLSLDGVDKYDYLVFCYFCWSIYYNWIYFWISFVIYEKLNNFKSSFTVNKILVVLDSKIIQENLRNHLYLKEIYFIKLTSLN